MCRARSPSRVLFPMVESIIHIEQDPVSRHWYTPHDFRQATALFEVQGKIMCGYSIIIALKLSYSYFPSSSNLIQSTIIARSILVAFSYWLFISCRNARKRNCPKCRRRILHSLGHCLRPPRSQSRSWLCWRRLVGTNWLSSLAEGTSGFRSKTQSRYFLFIQFEGTTV